MEYSYDAFGNRQRRVAYDASLAVVSDERFAYDGWDTAKPWAVGSENFDALADLDAAGNVTARRVFGAGFDELAARLDGAGAVAWYLTDRQGSVRVVSDNAGTVVGSRAYDGFGAITVAAGAGLDRYAYTGREWDAALNLQYTRARMYDSAISRVTTEDPLGQAAGDANVYRYVSNTPANAADPSGMFILNAVAGAGVGVVFNGVVNIASGRTFFHGWQGAAVGGAVMGVTFGLTPAGAAITRGGFGPAD